MFSGLGRLGYRMLNLAVTGTGPGGKNARHILIFHVKHDASQIASLVDVVQIRHHAAWLLSVGGVQASRVTDRRILCSTADFCSLHVSSNFII